MIRHSDWKFQMMRAGQTVRMASARQMRKDVDSWPLIAHPKGPAELRINTTLTHLNGTFADKVRDCLSGKFAWSKDSFDGGEWQRTIKVTMHGPRLLSMVAADGFYCGTAHPDDDLVVLVFNLETGEQGTGARWCQKPRERPCRRMCLEMRMEHLR
jgi:hypothetical protein